MRFEIGKCYQHTTGKKVRMIAKVTTHFYGEGLLGETDDAEYIICGMDEHNAVNYHECEDFADEMKFMSELRPCIIIKKDSVWEPSETDYRAEAKNKSLVPWVDQEARSCIQERSYAKFSFT